MENVTSTTKEMNYDELKKAMRRRLSHMKTGRWKRIEKSAAGWLPTEWEDGRTGREKKILGALYGTDDGGKPGLEVLQEEAARIKKDKDDSDY